MILNRHVFLNTTNSRRGKYSYEWVLCGTDIKLRRYYNMESTDMECNKPQSQGSISHQLVVRKMLLWHQIESLKLYKVKTINRITFRTEFRGLWQLSNGGPLSAQTTGGHPDIKQSKVRNIISNPALTSQHQTPHWFWCLNSWEKTCKQVPEYGNIQNYPTL